MLAKRGINLDPKWNKSSSSRPCFLHFYDLLLVFIKQGAILRKNDIFNIGQLPKMDLTEVHLK